MRILEMAVVPVLAIAPAWIANGKDKPDPRVQAVTSIFVAGNNQAAEKARSLLRGGKTCFVLADRAADADAVLEITAESQTKGGMIGSLGARNWIASGTLTLKSGELIWSKSERFGDAPFMSGGKTAGELLIHQLGRDADCKSRKKARAAAQP